ncbi:MAG: GNAT family N-acetyltransferase [Clostridia bacterium]|nr:GNAT family N-acetyltransferase [Clostridia bacterium]
MKKFNSKEAFLETVGRHISKNTLTNGALTLGGLSDFFDGNDIEYSESEESLLLTVKREFHDYLTFYISSDCKGVELEAKRDISCEILYKGTDSEAYKSLEILSKSGFYSAFTRNRMIRKQKDVSMCEYDFANTADCDGVYSLLYSSFSYLTGCLPSRNKIMSDISDKKFIVLRNENEIYALIHFEKGKRFADIKHMAVKKEYRGKGLTDRLLGAFLFETKDKTQRVWVRSDYIQPIKAYTKHGFVCDGMCSAVMIKKI